MLSLYWYRQHINWTTVIVGVVAWYFAVAIFGIILLITGLPHINYPNSWWRLDFALITDIATALSILGFGWILKQKKRSLWFLCIFIPMFYPITAPLFALYFQFPFWLIGFIITISLKKKS
jgi:hypothetical protein